MPTAATRVVVTGVGAVTPIGLDAESFRGALYAGRSGVAKITQFDCDAPDPANGGPQFTTRIAAEVRGFDAARVLRKAQRYDRASQLALAAARMALDDAGLLPGRGPAAGMGIVVGTGGGDMRALEGAATTLAGRGARRVSATAVTRYMPSALPANLAILLGARGPNLGISSACASATHAIGEAYWMIRRGDAEVMLSGGAEAAITPVSVAAFGAMGVLSRRNDDPEGASRPFDGERDGFVIGEGAGLVVLESLESARSRGARVHAEIVGYGLTADAYNPSALRPDPVECVRAIRRALAMAGLGPEDVDYVNAHGTSTRQNDALETTALKAALGERAHAVPVSSTKSLLGHLLSAAGAVEVIATLFALRDQRLHPTLNRTHPDPDCDLDYVTEGARPAAVGVALKTSFGLGGHNACLALRRHDG